MVSIRLKQKAAKSKCKIESIKAFILPIISIAFILLLIIFSKTAVSSALKGIDLWLNVVFPSLFPFLTASELLNGTSFVKAAGILLEPVMRPLFNVPGCASFPFATGMTSGYPVGAKVVASMKENKLLNKWDAEKLLAFCNNSSPLFIIGAVSTGMLKMPQIGPLLLICHLAAGITVGFIYRFIPVNPKNVTLSGGRKPVSGKSGSTSNIDFGSLLGNAVRNSVTTLLVIGGFIILFSVIIGILMESGILNSFAGLLYTLLKFTGLPKELYISLISGFIEITTGLGMLCSSPNITLNMKLITVSAIIGWGGISVHMQVMSVVRNAGLSIKPYLMGKCVQSILSAIYTMGGLKLTGLYPETAALVFKNFYTPNLRTWNQYLLESCKQLYLFALLFFILVISVFTITSLVKFIKRQL